MDALELAPEAQEIAVREQTNLPATDVVNIVEKVTGSAREEQQNKAHPADRESSVIGSLPPLQLNESYAVELSSEKPLLVNDSASGLQAIRPVEELSSVLAGELTSDPTSSGDHSSHAGPSRRMHNHSRSQSTTLENRPRSMLIGTQLNDMPEEGELFLSPPSKSGSKRTNSSSKDEVTDPERQEAQRHLDRASTSASSKPDRDRDKRHVKKQSTGSQEKLSSSGTIGTNGSRRQLGEWTLGKTIGAGSMGKVKLAVSTVTGEKVCPP